MDEKALYRYLSGTASPEEAEQVLEWIEENEENKNAFLRERRLYDSILFSDDSLFEVQSSGRRKKLSIFVRNFVRFAAIFALAFVLAYFYFGNKKQQEPVVTMNTITVPAGQRVNLTMSDGTNVWLNARSILQYPTTFASDKRQVKLDGEAYFDVSKNKEKPFVVETKKYKVEVFGTQFNIQSYSENEAFETALMEGSVVVESNTDIHQRLTLLPNHMVSEKNEQLVVTEIIDYDSFRWKEGLICFKNQPFSQVMYEFEKTFGTKIVIRNKKVLQRLYTGKFRQSDGVGHALRVLQLSISFQFQRDDENNIIYVN